MDSCKPRWTPVSLRVALSLTPHCSHEMNSAWVKIICGILHDILLKLNVIFSNIITYPNKYVKETWEKKDFAFRLWLERCSRAQREREGKSSRSITKLKKDS